MITKPKGECRPHAPPCNKAAARKEPATKIAKALKRTEGATRQKAKSERISLSMTRKKRVPAKKR